MVDFIPLYLFLFWHAYIIVLACTSGPHQDCACKCSTVLKLVELLFQQHALAMATGCNTNRHIPCPIKVCGELRLPMAGLELNRSLRIVNVRVNVSEAIQTADD